MTGGPPVRRSPRVSVIVPAYNAAWSIERTIASILAQAMRDFELIVIDDGSTDATDAAVRRAARDDSRVRVVRQANRGLAGARNRGIQEACAPLAAPIDADDIWEPDYLSRMVEALDSYPSAPFAFAYHFRMDEHDRPLPSPRHAKPPRHDFAGLLSMNSVGCGSAAVFRRAEMVAAGGYDETLAARAGRGAEDWKLVLALAAKGAPRLIEQPLVGYRHVASGMSQGDPEGQLASMLAVIEDVREQHSALSRRSIRNARTMAIAWLLPAFLRRGRWGRAIRLAARAYVQNPGWFLDTNIRGAHAGWLRGVLRRQRRGACLFAGQKLDQLHSDALHL